MRSDITKEDRAKIHPAWELKVVYQLEGAYQLAGRWECEAMRDKVVRMVGSGATRESALEDLATSIDKYELKLGSGPERAAKDRDERQYQVAKWVERSFGPEVQESVPERVERLYEEVCELAQAEGAPGGVVHAYVVQLLEAYDGYARAGGTGDPLKLVTGLADLRRALETDRLSRISYEVYKKFPGDIGQEVGGISTTLLAYCESRNLSADSCERDELDRILALPPEHFKAKQAAKVESGMAVDRLDTPALVGAFDKAFDTGLGGGVFKAERPEAHVSEHVHGPDRLDWIVGYYGPELPKGLDKRLMDLAELWRDQVAVDTILNMTDEEVEADMRSRGLDPETEVEKVRGQLSATLEMHQRMTTAEARVVELEAKIQALSHAKYNAEVWERDPYRTLFVRLWPWPPQFRFVQGMDKLCTYGGVSLEGLRDLCKWAFDRGHEVRVNDGGHFASRKDPADHRLD